MRFSCGDRIDKKTSSVAHMPCLTALARDFCLPSGVIGPGDGFASGNIFLKPESSDFETLSICASISGGRGGLDRVVMGGKDKG